jgi:hypothetical protein
MPEILWITMMPPVGLAPVSANEAVMAVAEVMSELRTHSSRKSALADFT